MTEIETPDYGTEIEYIYYRHQSQVSKVKCVGPRTRDGQLMIKNESGMAYYKGQWRYPGETEWRR